MTTVLQAEHPSRLRVVITEDRSDSLVVPECRVRPGYVDPNSRFLGKVYGADNKPNKAYLTINAGKEVDCPVDGAVIISQGECHVILRSRIARDEAGKHVKAFAVLCKYGVVSRPHAVLVRQDGTDNIVTQVFSVNYTDNSEFGSIIFRCANDKLTYGKDIYQQHELLTVYLHRTRDDYDAAPYPPVLTLTGLQDQNYVPMVPGQILQIIPNVGEVEIEDCQNQGERPMMFLGKEPLTSNGKLWVYRYECIRVSEIAHPFFLKGDQTCSVIVPPMMCDDGDLFAVICHPYNTVKVMCGSIMSLRFRFANDIPIIRWPQKMIEIPSANTSLHELKIKFVKRMDSINLTNENGTCSISCTLPGFGTYKPPAKK